VRATSPGVIADLRRSSTDDVEEAADVDQGRGDVANPPRHLAAKLLEQNARLKNLARRLIADRGLTVADYLVCLWPPHVIGQAIIHRQP